MCVSYQPNPWERKASDRRFVDYLMTAGETDVLFSHAIRAGTHSHVAQLQERTIPTLLKDAHSKQ